MTRRTRTQRRILQIMPATGWWAVYADSGEASGLGRTRIPAFALVAEWEVEEWEVGMPTEMPAEVDHVVLPLSADGSYLDVDDCTNLMACVHADEWADREPALRQEAADWNARYGTTRPVAQTKG